MGLSQRYLLPLLLCLFACPALDSQAQHAATAWQVEVGTSVHLSGYCGDIGNKGEYGVFSDTQWYLMRPGAGVHARAIQSGKRVGFNFEARRIRIQGADSLSNKAVAFVRNLHFRNDMTELAASADFPLLRLGGQGAGWTLVHTFRAQVGLALLHHAPRAQVDRDNLSYDLLIASGYTTPDAWHDLRTAQTEGSTYARWVATIPIGLSWNLSADNGSGRPWHVSLVGLWRWTFTDRLDDIHDQYANPWEMTPLGIALSSQSNPADQPPCADMPGLSTFQYQQGLDQDRQPIRGNKETNDMYFTIGLKASRSLFSEPTPSFHKKRFRGPRVNNKR